jgi:hypothetical protein
MNQRYEREIDELMNRLEGRMRREPLSRRLSRKFRPYSQGFRSAFAAFLRRPPTEQFMISAMVLVVISFAMGNFLGMGKWAFYVSIVSIIFFVIGLGLSLASRQSPGYQQRRWRGREIDYHAHGPTIWTHLRNWFRRRRR